MYAVATSRPTTVEIGVLILCVALAISLVTSIVRLGHTTLPVSPTLVYSIVAIAFSVGAFVVYSIYSGRNWARLTYLALTLLGMFKTVPALVATIDRTPFAGTLSAVVVAAQLVALALLFTGPSNAWFRRP
jgi:hypothetical protein